jgi:hypothetical protein
MKGRSKALTWINKLKNRGIKEFEFHKLPEDVRDWSSFKRAISEEAIIKIRRCEPFWRIK